MWFLKAVNALQLVALVARELRDVLSLVLSQKECVTTRALNHILSCHYVQFKSPPTQVIELIDIKYFLHDVVSSTAPFKCLKCFFAIIPLGQAVELRNLSPCFVPFVVHVVDASLTKRITTTRKFSEF